MLGIFSGAKIVIFLIIAAAIAGGYFYIDGLKKDNEILKLNQAKLEDSIETQAIVIEQQKEDFKEIKKANDDIVKQNQILANSIDELRSKFEKVNGLGEKRDLGKLALEKTSLVEKIINNATENAHRCMEIAMGSALTEEEKNAEKISEFNPECPDIYPNNNSSDRL
jgi:hypothetical protein